MQKCKFDRDVLKGSSMDTKINLELTAKDAVKGVEKGDIIVVIDVLRCSSTIITSLAN